MCSLHDPTKLSCHDLTKLSCMIKHFQIDVEKWFVNFYCFTIRFCKAFTVLIFKYDISENRNALKMVFSVPFNSIGVWKRKFWDEKLEYNSLNLVSP